jgi:hypothetical protein
MQKMTIQEVVPTTNGGPQPAEAKSAFPHLGGGFIGFSAIAYFISWQQSYTYYNELGAPWFIKGFSTTRLLMESGVLLTVLLLLGVFALGIVGRRRLKATTIAVSSVVLGVIGLVVMGAGFLGSRLISPVMVFRLSQVAIVLFGMSTALLLAGVITGALESGQKPVTLHVWLMVAIVSLGLWRAPVLAGRARASRDANPTLSTLPVATGPNAADSGWRLIAILDRKFLLMKPAVRRQDRLFRVTENFDGWTTSAGR